MAEYSELLRHPFWQKKRLLILARDKFTCLQCFDTLSNLQIHHDYYEPNTMPWDYPDECFETLCGLCHTKAGFYHWMKRTGFALLIRLGLTLEDAREVCEMICRRVKENLYRDDVLLYISDIKKQLNG